MRVTPFFLCALLLAPAAHADAKRGANLHQQNCVACHARMTGGDGSALYTRADRRVQSLPGLNKQVRRCKDNLGLTWFDEEVEDVANYLNATYYKFKP
jgi:mono/diheme cytochrome c family protein